VGDQAEITGQARLAGQAKASLPGQEESIRQVRVSVVAARVPNQGGLSGQVKDIQAALKPAARRETGDQARPRLAG
jgi:hypothetical protein